MRGPADTLTAREATSERPCDRGAGHETPPDVDVGVIYTHEDRFMPLLLSSLSRSAETVTPRLILVDNASKDGVAKWAGYFDRMLVVKNRRRLNYGPNLNRILTASSAKYVLLLNTDMHFDPQERTLDKMAAFMDRHPDCGIAGCRLYRDDGSYTHPARRFPTPRMIAARRLGRCGALLCGAEDALLYRDHDPGTSFRCDWLSGCFLMVRRRALLDVGGFDERFTKYFEDVDFCARMAAGGWTVMFHGGTFGYHLEQRASQRLFSRDAWLHLRSYLRWLAKWGFNPDARISQRLTKQPATAPLGNGGRQVTADFTVSRWMQRQPSAGCLSETSSGPSSVWRTSG